MQEGEGYILLQYHTLKMTLGEVIV